MNNKYKYILYVLLFVSISIASLFVVKIYNLYWSKSIEADKIYENQLKTIVEMSKTSNKNLLIEFEVVKRDIEKSYNVKIVEYRKKIENIEKELLENNKRVVYLENKIISDVEEIEKVHLDEKLVLENAISNYKSEIVQINNDYSIEIKSIINTYEDKINNLEIYNNLLNSHIVDLDNDYKDELKKLTDTFDRYILETENEIQLLLNENSQLIISNNILKEESKRNSDEYDLMIERYNSQILSYENELNELKNEELILYSQIEMEKQKNNDLSEMIIQLENSIKKIKEQYNSTIVSLESEIMFFEENIDNALFNIDNNQISVKIYANRISILEQEINILSEQIVNLTDNKILYTQISEQLLLKEQENSNLNIYILELENKVEQTNNEYYLRIKELESEIVLVEENLDDILFFDNVNSIKIQQYINTIINLENERNALDEKIIDISDENIEKMNILEIKYEQQIDDLYVELDVKTGNIEKLNEEIVKLENEKKVLDNHIIDISDENIEYKQQIDNLYIELDKGKVNVGKLNKEIENLENERKVLDEKIVDISDENIDKLNLLTIKYEQQIDDLYIELDTKKGNIEKLNEEIVNLEDEKIELNKHIVNLTNNYENKIEISSIENIRLNEIINKLEKLAIEVENTNKIAIERMQSEIQNYQEKLEIQNKDTVNEIAVIKNDYEVKILQLSSLISTYENENIINDDLIKTYITKIEENQNSSRDTINKLNQEIDFLNNEIARIEEIEFYKTESSISKYKNEISMLKDIISKMELVNSNNTSTNNIVNNSKTVYLTFDDGPSEMTIPILDILDRYNIKATFFLLYHEGYEYEYQQIYERGHTLGNHTASHDYNLIYSSVDAFYDDVKLLDDYIYSITGSTTMILRFPGGTSYTWESNEVKMDIMEQSYQRGYIYYDWNASAGDGAVSVYSEEDILLNATRTFNNKNDVFLLMHDSKKTHTTVDALDDLIEFYLEKGYEFLPITYSTPQCKMYNP